MKKIRLTAALLALLAWLPASAQYSDIANGITNVLMPALSGSSSYKGFVEGDFTQGFGKYRTSFATISTSQGYQFSNVFYMGAGLGVDLLWSNPDSGWGTGWQPSYPDYARHSSTTTSVMIPVFTDFRLTFGDKSQVGFFIDAKVGAAFLCTNKYVRIRNGYLTNTSYFYLQPSLGVRIPTNPQNPKQAFNIGVHYRLVTSDYWSGYQSNIVLNGVGVNVSYEW